jgi:pimeloyl-ACP methyl ester carboxylesterase
VTTVTMVAANGIRQHVQQIGPPGAPTVVCVHGILTDSLASWYFTIAGALADAGLRVVMYDLRGHGRSDRPPTGYRLDDFVADLAALLDELAVTGPVYLLGNSFGGTVAFGLAIQRPDRVAGVAFIESEPATPEWAAKMATNLARARTDLARPEAYPWITVRYGVRTTRLARGAARILATTTLATDLPASTVPSTVDVRCPVLAIYGAKSDLAAQAPWLTARLARCTTAVVPGQEHSVLIEVPDTVRDLVLSWLRGHDRDRMVGADDR